MGYKELTVVFSHSLNYFGIAKRPKMSKDAGVLIE